MIMNDKKEDTNRKKINLTIDDKKIETDDGDTILQVAKKIDIHIPTLCYNEKIKPHGACRLCLVEIEKRGRSKIVASCAYPAEEGLVVKTESPAVEKIRKNLVELYLALFPFNPEIKKLAKKYKLTRTRFKKENKYCILCGLCVRYCKEVKGYNAVGFVGRGTNKKVIFIPESSFFKYCEKCMECMNICPTGVFPPNYGLDRIPRINE